jgi:hypothetical protein
MATRLTKLQINEVSLCSSGANPGAMIVLCKRDIPTDEIELPEEYDDSNFDASGRGPMHERLWTLYDDNRRSSNYAKPAFQAAWDALTPDEKQTVRNEEAAHAAAVQAQTDAKQMESEKEMNKSDNGELMIKLAHGVMRTGIENTVRRSSWHRALRKLAAERQEPGEKIETAVARLVKSDKDARALFSASCTGVADDTAPAPVAPAAVLKSGTAYSELRKIADGIVSENPGMTRYQGFAKAYSQNPELAQRSKTEQAFA